jgi:hypothetical protein
LLVEKAATRNYEGPMKEPAQSSYPNCDQLDLDYVELLQKEDEDYCTCPGVGLFYIRYYASHTSLFFNGQNNLDTETCEENSYPQVENPYFEDICQSLLDINQPILDETLVNSILMPNF